MVNTGNIDEVMGLLEQMCGHWRKPAVTNVARQLNDPFQVMVSCIISLRTRDEVTEVASKRIHARAATPEEMARLEPEEIAELIFPAGFYKTKAAQISVISRQIVEQYGGRVPDTLEQLMQFKGVGRKTANLVITLGFGKPGICVDTHVHRITNRWGYVNTSTPDKTEQALRKKLPGQYWVAINDLLVAFGQNLCHPVSPRCSICLLPKICERRGIKHSR